MTDSGADRRGQVLVLCAPSGTGKSTLVRRLMDEFPGFGFSVSCTTRAPRAGEVDGEHYRFVSREEFLRLRGQGHFAEWAEVHGNFYGTPKKPVQEMLDAGRDVLFDIDVQGARQLREAFPDGLYVFVLPPSAAELEHRLVTRGADAPEVIEKRMRNAVGEMRAASEFGHIIVNDDLDAAYDELRAAYLAGRTRPDRRPGLVDAVISSWSASNG